MGRRAESAPECSSEATVPSISSTCSQRHTIQSAISSGWSACRHICTHEARQKHHRGTAIGQEWASVEDCHQLKLVGIAQGLAWLRKENLETTVLEHVQCTNMRRQCEHKQRELKGKKRAAPPTTPEHISGNRSSLGGSHDRKRSAKIASRFISNVGGKKWETKKWGKRKGRPPCGAEELHCHLSVANHSYALSTFRDC